VDHSTTVSTPVATKSRMSSFRRIVATALTAALAAGGLSVVAAAAPASAVETGTVTGGTFSWKVSDQVKRHLSTQTVADDATIDQTTGIVTWVQGTGKVNTTTGASDVSYNGSANFKFLNPQNQAAVYSITVADPEVITTAAGAGTIKADVTWVLNASGTTAETTGTTNDVVITTFTAGNGTGTGTGDSWTGTDALTITDTPDWAGVIQPGSADATEIGVANADQPLDGKAFAKSFILALTPGLRSHFYASGTTASPTASNVYKAPSPFTATATIVATPVVTPTVVSETFRGGYVVDLSGDGFRAVTKPGDAGVYVGIAPAGGHPGYASADLAKFVVADWVNAAAIVDGKFTRTLTAETAKLDPEVDYALYTWQSHTHSNTSQDTETPLDIDFAALEELESSVTLSAPATVEYGSAASLEATVAGPASDSPAATGSVEFYDAETLLGTAPVTDGVATLSPAELTVGSHAISAKYLGDNRYATSTSSSSQVTVERAQAGSVALSLSGSQQVFGKGVTATVTVVGGTGEVTLLVDGKSAGTVALANDVAKVVVPAALARGTHSVVASYQGSTTVAPKDSNTVALKVIKATTSKVSISGSKYKKNTAPVVTVKVAKLNNGEWANGKIQVKIGTKIVKTATLYKSAKGVLKITLPKQTKSSITVKANYVASANINDAKSSSVTIKRK